MSAAYLKDEVVIVRYLPTTKNGILDTKHPLYGGLSSNASIAVPAPLLTRQIDEIFTKEELKFLGDELNEDLSSNSDFWKEYRKDEHGMPMGNFPIFLKKEGMMYNKKYPLDYIKIKILENFPIVASSEDEIKNRRSQYRFVLIKQNQLHTKDINSINFEKEAMTLHSKYEKDPKVLRHILTTFNKNVSYTSDPDFLISETWKLVKSVPKMFVDVVKDELLEAKIDLEDFVRYKLINRSNKMYYTLTGDPIRLDGEKNDLEGAARYFDSGAGQEMRLELQAKVKILSKK